MKRTKSTKSLIITKIGRMKWTQESSEFPSCTEWTYAEEQKPMLNSVHIRKKVTLRITNHMINLRQHTFVPFQFWSTHMEIVNLYHEHFYGEIPTSPNLHTPNPPISRATIHFASGCFTVIALLYLAIELTISPSTFLLGSRNRGSTVITLLK